MRFVLEADPEVADYVFFEPVVVREAIARGDPNDSPEKTLRGLQHENRIVVIPTRGDSGGIVHAYVDESPPSVPAADVVESHTSESFRIRGNELHIAGVAGYVHRDEFRVPTSGVSFPIVAGMYRVRVDELSPGSERRGTLRASRYSAKEHLLVRRLGSVMVVSAIVITSCLLSKLLLSWSAWILVMLFVAAPAIAIPQLWMRMPSFQRALQATAEKQTSRMPGLAATFDRTGD